MWNARYDRPDYVYGTEPAGFLEAHARHLPAGAELLCVADGEGRNSVWLAGQGHRVTAFDSSHVALAKARRLAEARGATVDFREADITAWDWTPERWDAVVAVFIQFMAPPVRARVFEGIARTLRPGGPPSPR